MENTRDKAHGDLATNLAMTMAKAAGKTQEKWQLIVAALPANTLIAKPTSQAQALSTFISVTPRPRA